MLKKILGALFALVLGLCLALSALLILSNTGVLPYKVYLVEAASMRPTITPGTAVIVHEGVYQIGGIITFDTPNGLVTHRLISENSDGSFATKGDANTTTDPSFLPKDKIIGGMVASIPMAYYWVAGMFVLLLGLWVSYSIAARSDK